MFLIIRKRDAKRNNGRNCEKKRRNYCFLRDFCITMTLTTEIKPKPIMYFKSIPQKLKISSDPRLLDELFVFSGLLGGFEVEEFELFPLLGGEELSL